MSCSRSAGWRRGPSQPGCHCGPRPCCLLVGSASVSAPCVSPLLPTWSRELLWPHSGCCSARCPPDLGAPCPGLSPFLAAALTRSLVPGFPPGPGPCLYSPVSPLKGRHMPRTPSRPWSCTPHNQPLAPAATLQSHKKSPRTCRLLSPRKGAGSGPRGPQPWPTTVMSLPLFPDGSLLGGFSRITHHTPTPFLLSP